MYAESEGKHNMPHVHAIYSGHEVVVAFDGTVLEGSMPANKMRLILAWVEIHKEDLQANWQLLNDGEPCFKIDPLR